MSVKRINSSWPDYELKALDDFCDRWDERRSAVIRKAVKLYINSTKNNPQEK